MYRVVLTYTYLDLLHKAQFALSESISGCLIRPRKNGSGQRRLAPQGGNGNGKVPAIN
jgi:hypothetical protein